ncbi:MAG: hypothetical protein HYU28_07615 [Actinobacteria bacterium]|nr:hypothetical protein [Actinomycetota bacterium]
MDVFSIDSEAIEAQSHALVVTGGRYSGLQERVRSSANKALTSLGTIPSDLDDALRGLSDRWARETQLVGIALSEVGSAVNEFVGFLRAADQGASVQLDQSM